MDNSCVLRLDQIVFDEISFKRENFKLQTELKLEFNFNFENGEDGNFVTCIRVVGTKEDEYQFVVRASGYFNVGENVEGRTTIIRQNAVAIVFPYIRSQITLLTAQPGMDPIVLQPFNIAQMVEDAMKKEKR